MSAERPSSNGSSPNATKNRVVRFFSPREMLEDAKKKPLLAIMSTILGVQIYVAGCLHGYAQQQNDNDVAPVASSSTPSKTQSTGQDSAD